MAAKELENLGYPGPAHIRQVLSKTRKANTLINAIKKFQADNELQQESLAPAFRLLDMHDVRRADFHELVVTDLSDKLLQRIRQLGKNKDPEAQKKLETQLEQCFRMYKIAKIRPIVLETLKQLPRVPDRYLKIIICDPELYDQCAVSVRQQIWLKNDELFEKAVRPVIDDYLRAKKAVECAIEPSTTNFFSSETTKSRRQWDQVQELIQMVNDHDLLYEKLIKILRTCYVESGNVHLCSLRLELVMAAHDVNVEYVVRSDPSYEFAKCVDACVRDKHMDVSLTGRLKNVLEKKNTVEEIGDIAMIAWDSHVVHFLCSMITKVMRDGSSLPRESGSLQMLVKLLALGSHSLKILSTLEVPPTLLDPIFLTKFIPAMTSMVVEDVMRFEILRSGGEVPEEFKSLELLSEPSDTIVTFLKAEIPAALLWIHHTLEMFPSKRRTGDFRGLMRYVRSFGLLKDKMVLRGPWCHLVVHRLLASNIYENIINNSDIQHFLIDELLMENLELDAAVKYQLLRLIYQLHIAIGLPRCMEIMEKISPDVIGESLSEVDREKYTKDYGRTMVRITPKPVEEEHPSMMHPGMTPMMVAGTPMHPSMTPRMMPPGFQGHPGHMMHPSMSTPSHGSQGMMGPPGQHQMMGHGPGVPSGRGHMMTPQRQPYMTPRQQ